MKVLHLSTSDVAGGASRAAWRLHKGLHMCGISSGMFVRDKNSDDPTVISYKNPSGSTKILYKLRQHKIRSDFQVYKSTRPKGLEVFSDDRSALKTGFAGQLPAADLYHLHWTSGFVDLASFFSTIKKPVVLTLHDMFPFTGGCHYNNGCEMFKTHCQSCPQLGSKVEKDLSYQVLERKRKAITSFKNMIIIRADSHWLTGEARKSILFRDLDTGTIHYGIETDEFVARDKMACRKALNIPADRRVIVFGAPGIDNPRKGYRELIEAMRQLGVLHSNLFLLSFGTGSISGSIDIPMMHLGHITNNHLLSIIYNCADVFVIPSLQEAFGQTALEAMSCRVPVAGFDAGGIPDMVENGVTGYLARAGNIQDLAGSIDRVLDLSKDEYSKMADTCREKVLTGFTLSHQAEEYIRIYRQLI